MSPCAYDVRLVGAVFKAFFVRRGRYLLYKMYVFLDEILYLSKFIK